MFDAVVVLFEGLAGIERRVDIDALDLPRELLFQCFERQQVVPKDEAVVEDIAVADAVLGVIALLGVLQENARLDARPVLLADPGEFEFGLLRHGLGATDGRPLRRLF